MSSDNRCLHRDRDAPIHFEEFITYNDVSELKNEISTNSFQPAGQLHSDNDVIYTINKQKDE